MKNLLNIFFLLVFSFTGKSQSSVTHTRMNILYQGIDNNITISYNSKPEETEISVSKGKLTKKSIGYIFNCKEIGTVYFTIKSKGGPTVTRSFRIKELPKPIFRIDDIKSRIIDKAALENIKELKGRLGDFDYFIQPVISRFEIQIIKHNGEIQVFQNKGNFFNNEILDFIKSLNKNDVIVISKISYNYVYSPGREQEKFIKKGETADLVYVVR